MLGSLISYQRIGYATMHMSFLFFLTFAMVEPLLSGIVLGLVPVTMTGLFVTAYLQYRRGDRITNSL